MAGSAGGITEVLMWTSKWRLGVQVKVGAKVRVKVEEAKVWFLNDVERREEGKRDLEIKSRPPSLIIRIQVADWLDARGPLGKSEKLWWFRIERNTVGWGPLPFHGPLVNGKTSICFSFYAIIPLFAQSPQLGAPRSGNPPTSPLAPCLAFSFLCPEFLRVSTQKEGIAEAGRESVSLSAHPLFFAFV